MEIEYGLVGSEMCIRDRSPGDVARAISDTLPDGLIAVDGRGLLAFANLRAEEILQAPIGDCIGRPIREALPLWDSEGRPWWDVANPWTALHTVKGHREKLLWTSDGVEVLATARYPVSYTHLTLPTSDLV